MSMRLGGRVLGPDEMARQRALGAGTRRAGFRPGQRITGVPAGQATYRVDAMEQASAARDPHEKERPPARMPKDTGRPAAPAAAAAKPDPLAKARAAKAALAAARKAQAA